MEAAAHSAPDPLKQVTRLWWIPLITGIAFLIVSLVILRFDNASITAIGILTGITFIAAGVNDLVMVTLVDKWQWAYLTLGVVLIIVGGVAMTTPQDAFWASGYFGRKAILVIVFVAAAAMARGITQIVIAFQLKQANEELS